VFSVSVTNFSAGPEDLRRSAEGYAERLAAVILGPTTED
jgi:hypothetical protein